MDIFWTVLGWLVVYAFIGYISSISFVYFKTRKSSDVVREDREVTLLLLTVWPFIILGYLVIKASRFAADMLNPLSVGTNLSKKRRERWRALKALADNKIFEEEKKKDSKDSTVYSDIYGGP